ERGIFAIALMSSVATIPFAHGLQDINIGDWAEEETVLFSADHIHRETENTAIMAEGNVKAFFGAQRLSADRVTYNPNTDIVTAAGNVTIFDENGQVYFADDVELTGDLKDGVASNFTALLSQNSRLVSATTVRRSSGENDLNKAAYTACSVCKDSGEKKQPTWQVKARKITQDTEDQTIRFRDATVEVLGVPVVYTPYLQFPDPSVKRKSGFLIPSVAASSRLGVEAQIPYYWAISDYQDITFSPRVFTELGTLIKGEYRVNRHDAGAVLQAGFINPNDSDIAGDTAPNSLRWHFFSSGYKDLDNDWRAEYDIDIVSDKSYLRAYDVEPEGDLREAIDILQPDRLESELSFVRRRENSYTDISTVFFQSLRTREDNDFMADALPRFRHEKRYDAPWVDGEMTLKNDVLVLHRPRGLDTMRASTALNYDVMHTTKTGHRLKGFAELRGDIYRYTDADQGIQACNVNDSDYETCRLLLPRDASQEEYTTARLLPTIGVEWAYPLAKLTNSATYILEPRVQLVASPTQDYTDDVFNEDSQFFQFDEGTLFDWSKGTGLDQWEDGQRMNIGLSGTAVYTNGVTISGMIGQQYRHEETTAFDPDTGLGETTSDFVGNLDVNIGNALAVDNRFRFDDSDGTLRRAESTLRSTVGPVSAYLSYLRLETQELEALGRRDEFLTTALSYQFNQRWSLGTSWRENLESGTTTSQNLSLRYRDDCTLFSLTYRFDNTRGDNFDLNRSLTFNIDLIGF
ncbi:MAG: LPS assembly protein LptD, partial [Pseudomonadota bacterium]